MRHASPTSASHCAVSLLALVALVGCGGSSGSSGGSSSSDTASTDSSPTTTASADELLAVVGTDSITVADVRESSSGSRLAAIEAEYRRQRSDVLEQAVEALVRERLLEAEAESRDMTVNEMFEAESEQSLEVTDADVEAWYEENRSRLRGRSLESIRDQIEARIRNERRSVVVERLLPALRDGREVEVFVEPYRVALDNEGTPADGPEDAPVTLVEFSDFECPYCGRFYPTLKLLKQNYGDRLRVVYRHFPLTNIHPNAWKAAEASMCAHEEGKFWEYHDRLFQSQEQLGTAALVQHAEAVGLDRADFEECLESGRHQERVQSDLEEGRSVGVNGTPALFVNGIQVPGGAVPYRTVADVIDEELARVEG